ncbi:PLP-dependent aminotransferase family protein [Cryobacterium sp. PAMC25264]|uniref:aminotransferase-like domain-containing protein n=1 Tax=Cryobacterium sp. PAMC25264 TaxID=2861288 RepID=UPI001C62B4B8|nr:PLP-dependent aminotransferase family protein [Cryobacterium sp. PAMC25264]QYF72484.1 PLP-dependent aminotransferase family protein [Cryobacterium sp. PAMC25264]
MHEDSTTVDGPSGESAHLAIERRLRRLAATRPAGERLPSTRTLVREHAASPLTVQRAVQRLVLEGLVETRPGAGSFVARRPGVHRADFGWQTTALGTPRTGADAIGAALATAGPGVISLHSGYPAEELLPTRLVRSALVRAARTSTAVERAPLAGLPELLTWFAAELAPAGASAAAPATADDVVITPGGQSALSSIFRALAAPGDAIVMESPTYWGAMAAARQAGLRVVPIGRGAGAPAAGDLDDALAASGARLFYAQPHFANPTGALWTSTERADVLAVIQARGVYLIEDDWAHDFGIDAEVVPLAADDANGHIVYVRSLTKSVSPAIRVGAVVARGPALARIQADRTVDDLYVSGILQAAAVDVLTDPGWRSHLARLRGALRARRDEMARQVRGQLGTDALEVVPRGGLNLWVRTSDGVDMRDLARRSRAAGVLFSPGDDWFPAEPTGSFLRLNYSRARPEIFEEAVAIIAGLLP